MDGGPGRGEQQCLTRYEAARVVGMRALQLSEGDLPTVTPPSHLRGDHMYVAALELASGTLDARVRRGPHALDVRACTVPRCVAAMLDTRDGGTRSYGVNRRPPTP